MAWLLWPGPGGSTQPQHDDDLLSPLTDSCSCREVCSSRSTHWQGGFYRALYFSPFALWSDPSRPLGRPAKILALGRMIPEHSALRLGKPGIHFVRLASPSRRDAASPARSKMLLPRFGSGYPAPRYESLESSGRNIESLGREGKSRAGASKPGLF